MRVNARRKIKSSTFEPGVSSFSNCSTGNELNYYLNSSYDLRVQQRSRSSIELMPDRETQLLQQEDEVSLESKVIQYGDNSSGSDDKQSLVYCSEDSGHRPFNSSSENKVEGSEDLNDVHLVRKRLIETASTTSVFDDDDVPQCTPPFVAVNVDEDSIKLSKGVSTQINNG